MPENIPTHLDLFSGISADSHSLLSRKGLRQSDFRKQTHMRAQSSKNTGPTFQIMETCEMFLPSDATCSPEARRVSQQAQPGSAKARKMTAGSGRKLFEWWTGAGQRSVFLRTLLGSLLLTEDWSSTRCFLSWKPWGTKSPRRALFLLAPWMPRTRDCESGLLPTLTAFDATAGNIAGTEYPGSSHAEKLTQRLHRTQNGTIRRKNHNGSTSNLGLLPTLIARDWKDQSELKLLWRSMGTEPLPRNLGPSLTPNFCEAYMGYPIGWTELSASETPLSHKSPRCSPERSAVASTTKAK